jgi:hypothetical protein
VLPRRLEFVGKQGFYGCTALTELIIPEGVEGLGDETFKGCEGLRELRIPSTLRFMGSKVFEGCPRLSIRCEFSEAPADWEGDWNPDGIPVEWKA